MPMLQAWARVYIIAAHDVSVARSHARVHCRFLQTDSPQGKSQSRQESAAVSLPADGLPSRQESSQDKSQTPLKTFGKICRFLQTDSPQDKSSLIQG